MFKSSGNTSEKQEAKKLQEQLISLRKGINERADATLKTLIPQRLKEIDNILEGVTPEAFIFTCSLSSIFRVFSCFCFLDQTKFLVEFSSSWTKQILQCNPNPFWNHEIRHTQKTLNSLLSSATDVSVQRIKTVCFGK